MSVDCFLDTNILVYAVSAAEGDAARRSLALDLVARTDFGLSAQVLQEFYVTVTRKIRKPLPADQAVALMDEYRHFATVPTDYPLIVAGVEPCCATASRTGRGDPRGRRDPRGADALHRRPRSRAALGASARHQPVPRRVMPRSATD